MKWFAQMPSNIALIKYMGKTDPDSNIPSNTSLSYTLNDLLSFVEIESDSNTHDFWEPLAMPGGLPFTLTDPEQQKFLDHLRFIKQTLGYEGHFTVRSCNNFPDSCGLASSASSFAALTQSAVRAICELMERDELSPSEVANLSRQGSGSSCRSFFEPWAIWSGKEVKKADLPYSELIHHAVIVDHDQKAVSSSLAHQRVTSSPHFADRAKQTEHRLKALLDALNKQDWQRCYQLAWDEFTEMHQLFETAAEPFAYMTDQSKKVLDDLQHYWNSYNDGPIVTMDAGPNVHLLFRPDQADLAVEMKQKFLNNYDVI